MAKATRSNNIMGAVAYLFGFITGIILLLTEKKDPFIRFHAAQSTVTSGILSVVGVVLGVVLSVVMTMLAFIPFLGWAIMGLLSLLFALAGLAMLVAWLFLMWKAYSGEQFQVPMIAGLVKQVEKSIKPS